VLRIPATRHVQVGSLRLLLLQRRLCGGLTLLMRQLIIKPIIDTPAFTPREPSQTRMSLTGCSATPTTVDHKSMFRERSGSPDLPEGCRGGSGDKATVPCDRSACGICHRSGKLRIVAISKLNDVNSLISRTVSLPCCGSITRVPRGTIGQACKCAMCQYSHTWRPSAPRAPADHLTKTLMIGTYRGEGW
jgi:hypothetical protein